MFLSIQEMELRKIRFAQTFPPGAIEFFDQKLRQATPLEVSGTAELVRGTDEVRVRGRMTVRMEAECDRCLEIAAFSLDSDFDLFYRPASSAGLPHDLAIDAAEAELGFYEGGGLELTDIIREQVLLSMPMQRICRPECHGICPVCGANRNFTVCGCRPATVDDRWAKLRSL
jgi:uncharacterized protein